MEYQIISADVHVIEPPGTFIDRLPVHLLEDAPRVMQAADGGDGWSWDGKIPWRSFGAETMAGRAFEDFVFSGMKFEEVLRGSHDGAALLADMALDGIDASVLYPHAVLDAYALANRELGVACMRAYNDWLLDDYAGADPNRIIGLPVMPVDDGMEVTLAEFERVRNKGARGVFIPGCPARPYHDPYYEPLWQAASDSGLSVNFHRSHGGKPPEQDRLDNYHAGHVIRFFNPVRHFTNLIFSGVFDRFPKLKFVAAETNFGWLPFMMEMMEYEYEHHRFWSKLDIRKTPSGYVEDNLFCTFLEDHTGFAHIDKLPAGTLMFSNDYPHSFSLWPNSRRFIAEQMSSIPAERKAQLLAGNAMRVYNL